MHSNINRVPYCYRTAKSKLRSRYPEILTPALTATENHRAAESDVARDRARRRRLASEEEKTRLSMRDRRRRVELSQLSHQLELLAS